MIRTVLLSAFAVLCVWLLSLHIETSQRQAEAERNTIEKQERVAALSATPALADLLARGKETCPDADDLVIWSCGTTIRMPYPYSRHHSRQRRMCSSVEAPRYIGLFPLPDVISQHKETQGQRVSVSIPGRWRPVQSGGVFSQSFLWHFRVDDLPEFRACTFHEGDGPCFTLWFNGKDNLSQPDGFERPVPDTLEQERRAPEILADEAGYSRQIDSFLDLNGAPVAHKVIRPLHDKPLDCQFNMLHPDNGFELFLRLQCDQVSDWQQLLLGVLDEVSRRTERVDVGASCGTPPPRNARLRPQFMYLDVDQYQAMHDWAASRNGADTGNP